MSTIYQYQPLQGKQIRLLKIRRDGSRFLFDLDAVSLDDSPKYTAISYTWGSSERTHKLYTTKDNVVLPITKSAYDVINNTSDEYPVLWIDMICINQDDNVEKGTQVGMMGLVYQKSSHTVAYLSKPTSSYSDGAIDTNSDEDEDTEILYKRYQWRHHKGALARSMMAFWDMQNVDNEVSVRWLGRMMLKQVTKPVTLLYSPPWGINWRESGKNLQRERPYFFRKWIVQEIIRSPSITFQAGSHKMDLIDVGSLGYGVGNVFDLKSAYPLSSTRSEALHIQDGYLYSLRAKNNELYVQAKEVQMQDYAETRFSSEQAFRLLALLVDTEVFNVTVSRDRLFAILPLLDDIVPAEIRPDYVSSEDAVFRRLSRYLLCNNAAEVLCLVRFGHNDALPSWCVDWGKPLAGRAGEFAGTFPAYFRAGYTMQSRRQMIRPDGDSAVLMRGKIVHTITDIQRLSSDEWNALMQDDKKLMSEQGSDAALALYFWRERVVQNDQPFGGQPFASIIEVGGRIGLVPKRAETGDVIAVILGLQPLYLLRKHQDDWQIIGECFVPPYMRGEQLDGLDRAYEEQPMSPWQDFRIV